MPFGRVDEDEFVRDIYFLVSTATLTRCPTLRHGLV